MSRSLTRSHRGSSGPAFSISIFLKKRFSGRQAICQFGGGANRLVLEFDASNHVRAVTANNSFELVSTETASVDEYHHIVLAVDQAQGTLNNRAKLYLNANEISYGTRTIPTDTNYIYIDRSFATWYLFHSDISGADYCGLIDEVYYIDGTQILPSAVAQGNRPITYTGSYGTYGFLLDFEDNSSVAALGYDHSGNAYNWTLTGFALSDSSDDIPGLVLTASDLAVGSPELDSPQLQIGNTIALDLEVGSPELDSPTLTAIGINNLSASDLTINGPSFGQPFFLAYTAGSLGASWSKTSATVIGIDKLDSSGGGEAILIRDTVAAGPFEISQSVTKSAVNEVCRLVFDVAPTGSGKLVKLILDDGGSTSYAYAIFDPTTGECLSRDCTTDFRFLSLEADPLWYGFKRLVLMAQSNVTTTVRGRLQLCDSNFDSEYTGDNVGSVIVCNPQLLTDYDRRDFRWEIGEPEMRFYWTVHLNDMGLIWFRCGHGELGIDTHLKFRVASDLDCVLRRWQPAQDDLVFDFSGALLAGSGDPMAGTP